MNDRILFSDHLRRWMRSGIGAFGLVLCLLFVRQMGVLHALEHALGDEHTTQLASSSGQPKSLPESAHEACWLCLALADSANGLPAVDAKPLLPLAPSSAVVAAAIPVAQLVRIWHWLARGPPVFS
jgi:hypothetical protein